MKKRRLHVFVLPVLTIALMSSSALGQTPQGVLPSIRLAVPNDIQTASASTFADDGFNVAWPPDNFASDDSLAIAANIAATVSQFGSAAAIAEFEASSLLATGVSGFAPQVDASGGGSTAVGGAANGAVMWGNAIAQGTFEVIQNPADPTVTGGELRAKLVLVGAESFAGTGALIAVLAAPITVGANVDNNFVLATQAAPFAGWGVFGFIDGMEIFESHPGLLNVVYNASQPTFVGNNHFMNANVSGGGGNTPTANSSYMYSAGASYSIH